MKKFISNKFVLFFLGVIFVIALWIMLSLLFDKNGMIFPSPVLTFKEFFILLGESTTYKNLGFTFLRMLMGFVLSFVGALILGILAGNHPHLYQFLKPLMTVIKSIPTVVLLFLFIVLIAPKNAPIFLVFVVCFPILYEGVAGGIRNVDQEMIDSAKVDGANYFRTTTRIKLPLAVPYIIVGLVSSFALSFKIEIMAEVITGTTTNGLGAAISFLKKDDPTNMPIIFAYSLFAIILMLLVSLLEEVIKQILKKKNIVVFNNN